MAQFPSIPVPSIPLMVALWAEEGFHGPKRTLIEDDLDLTKTYFNDKTHAIGIHAGPQFNPREKRTVSFFQDVNAGGMELCLGPGVYPTLKGFNAFGDGDGIISGVRFNGPNAPRDVGLYDKDGNNVLPWLRDDLPPAQKIPSIPLVVRLSDQDTLPTQPNMNQPGAGYPPAMPYMCLTLVEDAVDLRSMFGPEWDATARSIIVQKGPDYSGGREGYVARLYEDPVTQADLSGKQEPAHLDVGPDDTFDHSDGLLSVAAGVFLGLSIPPFDFREEARAVRIVARAT